MCPRKINISPDSIPFFDRNFFGSDKIVSRIGSGAIGGKASGLAFIKDVILSPLDKRQAGDIGIDIPRLVVITTEIFDRFMKDNDLYQLVEQEIPDDQIAYAFQQASLPPDITGDLRALIASVHTPLAIRSSSLLEDAMYEPFAGVYGTKMIPNNQPEIDNRFKKLVETLKFVYASTFFKAARDYIQATQRSVAEEKMAVIVQEVVGKRFNDRFYPHLSGVARSFNFYPIGRAAPENGVVELALGLGKTIVEGGLVWSYSPAYPGIGPPVGSSAELLKLTQTEFWAIHMGKPPEHDPIRETEYLVKGSLADAELDDTLRHIASTYQPQNDRLVMGTGPDGPRVLTFSPILEGGEIPFNSTIKRVLALCEEAVGSEVEIEFAVTLDTRKGLPADLGFLQVRPMVVSDQIIEVGPDELASPAALAASEKALGNGVIDNIRDVVYVKPEGFEARHTGRIAAEIDVMNRRLVQEGRQYLLIGFGRWGSSDPWLGIPVVWGQVSNAKAIVEATLPEMNVELSQGSHFFHNLTSFQILYLPVHHAGKYQINWSWLGAQQEVSGTPHISHVRTDKPITVKVDGRSRQGVILT
jgi:hypothetical protein